MSLAACTTTIQSPPKSYSEHYAAADAHDQRAIAHERAVQVHGKRNAPAEYTCGDTVLFDQATSGGERLGLSTPCWDPAEEAAHSHLIAAERQRRAARGERRAASRLVETEFAACRNIPESELGHSPFAHRREIIAAEPHYEAGAIRGARVVYRRIPGLTEEWLRQDIACHQARFETLGESPTYLPDDPSLIAGTKVSVSGDRTSITVLIEAPTDESGEAVLERARALVGSVTAWR